VRYVVSYEDGENKTKNATPTPARALELMASNRGAVVMDREFGEAYDLAMHALGKMVPKEPDYQYDGYDPEGHEAWEARCPTCGCELEDEGICPQCGQAIFWRDNEIW